MYLHKDCIKHFILMLKLRFGIKHHNPSNLATVIHEIKLKDKGLIHIENDGYLKCLFVSEGTKKEILVIANKVNGEVLTDGYYHRASKHSEF